MFTGISIMSLFEVVFWAFRLLNVLLKKDLKVCGKTKEDVDESNNTHQIQVSEEQSVRQNPNGRDQI